MAGHIPYELVLEFLNSRASRRCEVCGADEGWLLPDAGQQRIAGLFNPREDGGYVMPGGIVPTIIVACRSCGNLRLFAEAIIAAQIGWKGDDG